MHGQWSPLVFVWCKPVIGKTLARLFLPLACCRRQCWFQGTKFDLSEDNCLAFQTASDQPISSKPKLKKLLSEPGSLEWDSIFASQLANWPARTTHRPLIVGNQHSINSCNALLLSTKNQTALRRMWVANWVQSSVFIVWQSAALHRRLMQRAWPKGCLLWAKLLTDKLLNWQ